METLEPRLLLSGSVLITEFMANNDAALADFEGDYPDWIELHNPTGDAVNLDGWFLTDDSDLLDLWRIPAITIPAGGYKVIFASDKDLDNPAAELHTDFKLNAGGDYLALVQSDGYTVEHEYAPEFPEQVEDISYGLPYDAAAVESVELSGEFSPARVFVPTNGSYGLTWTGGQAFDDLTWIDGFSAIGFETDPGSDTSYEGYFQTDLETQMSGLTSTAYMRIAFDVDDPSEIVTMTLRLRYDDGFVAYLNGVEIAADNETPPMAYDSTASAVHTDSAAVVMADFDVTAFTGDLVAGTNILAIHGLNQSAGSSDFLISPELLAEVSATSSADPVYFVTATPNGQNISGVLGIVKDTSFSVDRGFYDAPFALEIETNTDGAEIRYTIDGSTPTATHGTIYTAPITISGQTVLRAVAVKPGYQSSNVDTQTYIFIADVLAQPDNPTGYPTTWNGDNYTRPGDYGMDPEVVNDPAYVDLMESAFKSIPTISIVTDIANLFDPNTGIYIKATRSGMAYERPVSVEYFDAEGNQEFQIDAGLRMRGGASRNQRTTPKHSFRLIFRDMYGASKLNYPLFGEDATDSFDTIILRAGSNLSWPHHNGWPIYSENRIYAQYVRDQWAKDTQIAMGWDSPHNNYAHLYINGIYWGLYNPGERPSAPYAADYLGGDKDDYDVINSGEVIDGDATAWNQMISLGLSGVSGSTNYQQMTEMLDVEAFADYMIMNQYGGNFDWDHHNWHAYRNREAEGKWYFSAWDYEIVFVRLYDNRIDTSKFGQYEPSSGYDPSRFLLTRLWLQLMQNTEFKTMFGDRVHRHLFNDGLLTPDSVIDRWNVRSDQVYEAILGESARWGDYRRDVYYAGRPQFSDGNILYDRDQEWEAERSRLLTSYFPQRTDVVIGQYEAVGAYPSLDAPTFNVNSTYQHGGAFDPGDTMSMTTGAGLIVYTLDGTDPRAVGGGYGANAIFYSPGSQLPLVRDTVVKARVSSGGQWSALNEATFETAINPPLAITEINYNPPAPTDDERLAGFTDNGDFEFVEIHNDGPAVDLRTVKLAKGVEFDFAAAGITTIGAGEYMIVVRNPLAFEERYGAGLNVIGTYTGRLDNAGESLLLTHGNDTEIVYLGYDNSSAWPGRPDGNGATLELIDPLGDYDDPDNWRSSAEYLGSPGAAGSGVTQQVIINEVLTHTDGEPTDSIELYNTTGATIDIGGWFLSDTTGDYAKFRIPDSTLLGAGEYIVFDEHDFNASGLTPTTADDVATDFGLSGAYGDDVWLMVGDGAGNVTHYADHVEFDAAANGESFGRYPNVTGKLYPMSELTLGDANATPRVGPVVIAEVMYNPPASAGAAILAATFDTDAEGFVFVPNAFSTSHVLGGVGFYEATSGQSGGGLNTMLVTLGSGPISGGWSGSATVGSAGDLTVSFAYRVVTTASATTNQYVQMLASIGGTVLGEADGLPRFDGAGGGATIDSGWQTATVQLPVGSGDYAITLGAFADGSTLFDVINVYIDNVSVSIPGDSDDLEFIELYNPTALPIDLNEWRLRGGVDMTFDPGDSIPAGGRAVVLSFNPDKLGNEGRVAAFRQTYGIDTSVVLLGGWSGRLSDTGEAIRLYRPDTPPIEDPQFIPRLLEDQLDYGVEAPWPTTLAGESLHRTAADAWGMDMASWEVATADPGTRADDCDVPADFNFDCGVDLDDFVILKQNFGLIGTATRATGDANGDGNTDLDDFVILKQAFGTAAAAPAAAAVTADVIAEADPAADVEDGSTDRPKPQIDAAKIRRVLTRRTDRADQLTLKRAARRLARYRRRLGQLDDPIVDMLSFIPSLPV